MEQFIVLCRVSDKKQADNYSREWQEQTCREIIEKEHGQILKVYEFQESARKAAKAKQMMAVFEECRKLDTTLMVAKLERLSRDQAFLVGIRDTGVKFRVATMPGMSHLTLSLHAMMAQNESDEISNRTKAGMQIARQKGVKFGMADPRLAALRAKNPEAKAKCVKAWHRGTQEYREQQHIKYMQWATTVQDHVVAAIIGGLTLSGAANKLNEQGIKTYTGGNWTAKHVTRVLEATTPSVLAMAKANAKAVLQRLAERM